MTLIKSISGIRGTIGGGAGVGLNPLDIVKFTSAYATLIRKTCTVKSNKIVVGRDARISGEMVKNVVVGTLMGMGWDVIDIDLASTPTTELAVTMEGASGGIILTASHNPKQWNALKLLNEHGEFLNAAEGNEVLRIAEAEEFDYADVDHLGSYRKDLTYNQKHIDSVLALDLVDVEAIKKAGIYDDTIIILTADHGGIKKGHGGKTLQEMEIPFIIAGKNVKQYGEFKECMMQFDTASTIAYIFGLKQPQAWIGRPMKQVFK